MEYEKFITRSGGIGKTFRSADEAFKTADYATPIWRCETENERALSMVAYVLAFVFFVLLAVFIIYPAFNTLGGA